MAQTNTQTKTAVVTGASQGIGRALAIGLAQHGFDVVVSDIERQSSELSTVQQMISSLGRRSFAITADVSRKADVQGLATQAIAAAGRIDALVNNAGVLAVSTIEDFDEAQWEFIFAVNAKGTFLVTQAFLPHMKRQKYGRIVNIASIGGKRGAPGQSIYCSSKGAVLEFTRVLAMEAGPYGITANSVCPGIILTEMGRKNLGDQANIERWTQATSLSRLGDPEDVVGTVVFFASDASAYVTGQSLNVCGGIIMD
jgi:NAD(P)-dependent dehydrogenase (short-subunit alcohol dehydrogenase family)